jgi:tetratricopeptide (TPR) repeat protein
MRAAVLGAPRAVGLLPWFAGFWQQQSFPRAAMNRGILHYYLDQWDAAESFYLDAMEASQGRYYEVYSNLGAVYFKEGRYEEAARCYQVVLDDQPGNQLARERLEAMGR